MFNTSQVYSGAYNFSPSAGEIIMNAFGRVQVRPSEILTQHIQTAVMELNLVLSKFNNLQPNLWTVDLQTLPLTEGVATYSVPAETVQILDMYVRVGNPGTDRIMFGISRTEYASLADKTTEGPPNQFWFDRSISPEVTFYPVPDGDGPYTVYYYRVRNIQDALLTGGMNVEVPTIWLDALVSGLAHRLARIYAPALEDKRKMDADEAWQIAANQNIENTPMYIVPNLGGYYR